MATNSRRVDFLSLWRCKVDPVFYSTEFNECIPSPSFRTFHNGIGFDWHFQVYPNGKTSSAGKEERGHLSLYLCLDVGKFSCTVAGYSLFVEVEGSQKNISKVANDRLFKDQRERNSNMWGKSKYLESDLAYERSKFEAEYCRDGHITLGVHLKIWESEFGLQRVFEHFRSKLPNFGQNCGYAQSKSFEQIVVKAPDNPPDEKIPRLEILESDTSKILDFQIHTKDDRVIFCHKFVLVTNNEKFSALISESGKPFLKVEYSSATMWEVLHNIYRGTSSRNVGSLVLTEAFRAAEEYKVLELKLRCEQELIQKLTIDNSAEFLEQAHLYNLMILRDVAMNLIAENMEVVWASERAKGSDINDVKTSLFS